MSFEPETSTTAQPVNELSLWKEYQGINQMNNSKDCKCLKIKQIIMEMKIITMKAVNMMATPSRFWKTAPLTLQRSKDGEIINFHQFFGSN